MDLQYISDTDGKHTAVIIPIEEWNTITAKHQELKTLEKPEQEKKKSFRGSLQLSKKAHEDFQEHAKNIRNEWNNI